LKISYGITVHNESEELFRLTDLLINNIDSEDEIVICVDGNDEKVKLVLENLQKTYQWNSNVIIYNRKLDGNFADQKNSVIEKSSGDYIFHIDADEYPNEILIQQLKQILEINDVDLIWIPRVNTVDGFTQEDVQKWGWRVNEKGWVNYPDYQARVFRNDKKMRWTRPLHEYITGCKTYAHLPPQEELSLYHPKTKEKQEAQNKFYMDNFSRELLVRR
jgi:glycosyltransferase involved in cell wall biosynthesis